MSNENFSWLLLDTLNQPITSATPLPKILIRRVADNLIYDWNDDTFKSSGWATKSQDMTEVGAANLPGVYDVTLTVTSFSGYYHAYLVYNDAADVQNIASEFSVIDGVISNLLFGTTLQNNTAIASGSKTAILGAESFP